MMPKNYACEEKLSKCTKELNFFKTSRFLRSSKKPFYMNKISDELVVCKFSVTVLLNLTIKQ